MIKIAICDDESIYIRQIEEFLIDYIQDKFEYKIFKFQTGEDLLDFCEKIKLDILFLDIILNDVNGINIANKIRENDKKMIIIFVTSMNCYFEDAFRVDALQYLQKPIQTEKVKKDFERALQVYYKMHYKYEIKTKSSNFYYNIDDIFYINLKNRILFLHTDDDKDTMAYVGSIKEEEKKLKQFDFIKIHQAFLVNMKNIRIINKNSVILKNGIELPMSKHLAKGVKDRYNFYI